MATTPALCALPALALAVAVAGTGCAATPAAGLSGHDAQVRAQEAARRQRIAQLAPRVDGGDPAPAAELAELLLSADVEERNAPRRALAVLERAAAQGDGPAQAMLGGILLTGRFWPYSAATPLPGMRDAARGLALLQSAATQACVATSHGSPHFPSYRLAVDLPGAIADAYARAGRQGLERLWRARAVLHCHTPGAAALVRQVLGGQGSPQRQAASFALLLLADAQADIGAVRAGLAPDVVAAAEREAAALRERVAQSERHYPRPARRVMP